MASVASVDGTTIDYDLAGSGPVIVFVAGVFNLRDTFTPLAAELSSNRTVLSYDRRGRGESSDTPPYSIERGVEDLQALIVGIARRLPSATHRILPVEVVHGIDPGGTAAAIREFEQ